MKKIIYLFIVLFFVRCEPVGKHCPYHVFISEFAAITLSDKTTLNFGAFLDVGEWSDSDSVTEYFHQRQKRGKDDILVTFARSKKYSYELNPDLKERVKNHIPGREMSELRFCDKDFYKTYQVKINEKLVFENEKAKSETAWSNWMNDLDARDRTTSLYITLKPDNTLESYEFFPPEKSTSEEN